VKCPKCGYLGFDSPDRCRNCGYEFSLVAGDEESAHAGPVRPRATPLNPLPTLRPDKTPPRIARPSRGGGRPEGVLDRPLRRTPDSATLDLPLFDAEHGAAGHLPPPQRPLQVRMSGHPTPRPRVRAETQTPSSMSLDLYGQAADAAPPAAPPPGATAAQPAPQAAVARSDAPASSWIGRRTAAGLVDAALILLVDLITLYFALRLCGLEPAEWDVLPLLPLAAFFLILNGGYVVLLTGWLGQTLGKMALQIEVVADGQGPLGLGRAALRAIWALATLLPAGIGLCWALAGDGRPLHDRLAGTRVIRVADI